MKELKDEISRLHAENATLQAGYDAARLEIDHLRGATKMMEPAQPEAWLVYLPSIDTQHVYDSQDDMGYLDDLTNHADAEVIPLYPGTAPKAEVVPAGEYPPLPEPLEIDWPELHSQALGCGVEDRGLRDRYECAEYGWQDGVDKAVECVPDELYDADQMRAYADATCAMRAQAAHAAVAGQCEDAIELLGKYKELCEEIKRGDSYHIGRIDAAISVLAHAAPQPAVQQGDADVEGAIKSAFFRFFGAGAERDWHTEPGGWFIEGYRAAHPAAPVAQGDAEQRQMDAKHAAIYRWMLSNVPDAWNIINNWCLYAEAGTDELHDALAARAQAKEGGAA